MKETPTREMTLDLVKEYTTPTRTVWVDPSDVGFTLSVLAPGYVRLPVPVPRKVFMLVGAVSKYPQKYIVHSGA